MKTLALSGWGQPPDALASLLPEATHLAYAHCDSVEAALAAIADTARGYDRVVGWSLGGQLLVRAIAARMMQPKRLVLIAAPFQFVDSGGGLGMGPASFAQFSHNFLHHPLRTLHKAWELIAHSDRHADIIRSQMAEFSKDAVLAHDWMAWLSRLEGFSCEGLDFSGFPPTLIVQGGQDLVVEPGQAQRFAALIPKATLKLLPECGHAPHWHDRALVRQWIDEHAHV